MKNSKLNQFISKFLLLTLVLSIIFSVYRIFTAPLDIPGAAENVKYQSDYVLMLVSCILGLIVMWLPSFIHKRFLITVPNFVETLFYIFLYLSIYLGEVRNFYYLVPYWDSILHTFSAAMLASIGFSLVTILNAEFSNRVHLSPLFIALFAFCFALTMGVIWEIYEFTMDYFLKTNMQKFITYDGTILIGQNALLDTMKDIILDASSSAVVSVLGFLSLRKKNVINNISIE